ncbi:hypothetical protein M8J77_025826 [Diaphorina citri]|nr:hypothetical protein M8J77_025826 [Diaphorina citri]
MNSFRHTDKVVMKISIVFMLICIAITTTSASPLFNNWQESADLNSWSNPSSSFNKPNTVKENNDLNARCNVLNGIRKTRDIHDIHVFSRSKHKNIDKKILGHEERFHTLKQKVLSEDDLPIRPIGPIHTHIPKENELPIKPIPIQTHDPNENDLPIRPIPIQPHIPKEMMMIIDDDAETTTTEDPISRLDSVLKTIRKNQIGKSSTQDALEILQKVSKNIASRTKELRYNEPRHGEIHDITRKSRFPFPSAEGKNSI